MNDGGHFIDMTHACGDRFRIPLAGRDLTDVTFTCPQCGKTEGFTLDQISNIQAAYRNRISFQTRE